MTSRTYRFPKSRSKYFKDALKLAKGLPGYEKAKSHSQVTYGPTDAATDDLWELIKISGGWKGAAFLIDDEEVERDVWEKSFQDTGESPEAEEEPTEKPEAKKPEKAKASEPEAKQPEKATEAEPEAKQPEKAKEAEPEAKKPEKDQKKPEPRKPTVVQINPAPKSDNSGCGKKAAVVMLAAMMGMLSFFR